MYLDFSSLFHDSSKDRTGQGRVRIPVSAQSHPPEWSTVDYKTYPRFQTIDLDRQPAIGAAATIQKRRSRHAFDETSLEIEQLSSLLNFSCGITGGPDTNVHRAQPSGGARYPIEVYPLVFIPSAGLSTGVYHYNVQRHGLDVMWNRDFSKNDISALFSYPWARDAAVAFILTAVFERNHIKYGERGYRQILIEAGAILQNIYLVSTDLGVKCTAIDGMDDSAIEKLLDIDGYNESVLTAAIVGGASDR